MILFSKDVLHLSKERVKISISNKCCYFVLFHFKESWKNVSVYTKIFISTTVFNIDKFRKLHSNKCSL